MRYGIGVLRSIGGDPGMRPFAVCLVPIDLCRPEKLAPAAETLYNTPMGAGKNKVFHRVRSKRAARKRSLSGILPRLPELIRK